MGDPGERELALAYLESDACTVLQKHAGMVSYWAGDQGHP